MGKSKFFSRLKKFSKTVKNARKRAKEGFEETEIDDGRYKAEVVKCEMMESKNKNLNMMFQYKIIAGDFKGENRWKYLPVESEDNQMWLGRELKKYGFELPDDLTKLEEIAEIIDEANPEVKIILKTKDDNQYLYIDKLLSEIDQGDFGDEDAEEEDDDEDDDEDYEGDEDDEDDETDGDEDAEEDEEEDDDEDSEDDSEDDEGDEDEEETAEISVGMTVCFENKKGKMVEGKVVKLLDDEEKVKVKHAKKTYTLGIEDISLPEEDEEEEEEAPKKKKKEKKEKKTKKTKKEKKTKKKKSSKKKK